MVENQINGTNKTYTITYRQKPIRNWSKCKKTRNVWLFYENKEVVVGIILGIE